MFYLFCYKHFASSLKTYVRLTLLLIFAKPGKPKSLIKGLSNEKFVGAEADHYK